jgi:ribosomal protein S18 acetylase RimI-like enzyme
MAVIRDIGAADYDAVAAVHVRTWQRAYAGIVPAAVLDALDPARLAEYRRSMPARPDQRTIVAEVDGTIVGFASFGPCRVPGTEDRYDESAGELYAIYVDPAHWDTGVGRQLMDEVITATTGRYRELRLWVLADNDRARRFYERAGLAPDGGRDVYVPRGSTAELPEVRYAMRLG